MYRPYERFEMKLRNKKTGEIVPASNIAVGSGETGKWYDSLAELNEEWEDYEEPRDYWCLTSVGKVYCSTNYRDVELYKQMGNYFETQEEAEKAVEKLKAWKRLKDKGFRFRGWTFDDGLKVSICTNTDSEGIYDDDKKDLKKDLDLLFGSEE